MADAGEEADSYKYEEVSLGEFEDDDELNADADLGEDHEDIEAPDEDLQEAIKELQRRTGEWGKQQLHSSSYEAKHGEEEEAEEEAQPGADTVVKPSAIEDFIRNFLIKKKMHKTLDMFNTEWYEQKQEGLLADHPEDEVPDIYKQNQELEEQINRIRIELRHAQSVASKAQSTWDQFRKERDHHRMHHKRVLQEKNRLITDLKRLRKYYEAYEPTIKELKERYEAVMKDKMLVKLERDRMKAKVDALERQLNSVKSSQEKPHTKKGEEEETDYSKQKRKPKKPTDTKLPLYDAENPHLEAYYEPPDITTYQLLKTFQGHEAPISCVAFHPSKPVLATGSDDMVWKIWSIPDGELIMSGDGHQDWIADVAFHPRGTHLASSAGDGVVKLWDFVSASSVATFSDHTQAAWGVDFHHSGDFLVSSSMDHTARLWDLNSTKCKLTLRGHVDSVNSVKFQPYSTNICTGSGDKTVSLWDARSGLCVQTFYGHNNAINHVNFTLQGDAIGSCDADGIVKVWDVRMAAERATLEAGEVPANAVSFDHSGSILVAASEDSSLKVYDVAQMLPLGSLRGHEDAVQAVTFDCDSKYLVSGAADSSFRVWGASSST
eukprot:gb/GECG01005823.1/.p1 GENE.gb/GECG01005823.1/~~gb/GECG01005823.1/.p1  ORF type:complete len:606 (+),score=102.22 gb/GECG01005823.1/:1-1818(+)